MGDDLNDILVRFERTLQELKGEEKLTRDAPEAFKQFADEVNRRTGAERRRTAREGGDRRKSEGSS